MIFINIQKIYEATQYLYTPEGSDIDKKKTIQLIVGETLSEKNGVQYFLLFHCGG